MAEWTPKSGTPIVEEWTPQSGEEVSQPTIITQKKPKQPFINPIEIGQILSGNIPGAVGSIAGRSAIEDPRRGFSQFMGLGGATMAVMNPIGTLMGVGATQLLDIPEVKKATDISKGYVEKIPQQLLGFPEPIMGAIGTTGELARRTTPEQYRTGLKAGIGALAFGVGKKFDDKYRQWITNFPQKMAKADHQSALDIAQETKALGQSAKGQIQNDYKAFRNETANVPIDYRKTNQVLYDLYGTTKKGEKIVGEAILPKEFMDDMGNIIKEQPPKANLGLVYKIKDTISKHIKWGQKSELIAPEQARLRKSYFDFDKIIDESLTGAGMEAERGYLDAINQVAEQVYDITSSVDKLTKGISKTIPSPTKLLGAVKGTEQLEILKRLAEIEPKMNDVISRIRGIQTLRGVKNFLKRAGLITAEGIAVGGALRTIGGVGER